MSASRSFSGANSPYLSRSVVIQLIRARCQTEAIEEASKQPKPDVLHQLRMGQSAPHELGGEARGGIGCKRCASARRLLGNVPGNRYRGLHGDADTHKPFRPADLHAEIRPKGEYAPRRRGLRNRHCHGRNFPCSTEQEEIRSNPARRYSVKSAAIIFAGKAIHRFSRTGIPQTFDGAASVHLQSTRAQAACCRSAGEFCGNRHSKEGPQTQTSNCKVAAISCFEATSTRDHPFNGIHLACRLEARDAPCRTALTCSRRTRGIACRKEAKRRLTPRRS